VTRTQLLVLRGPAWLASRPGLALIAAALLGVVVALYAFGRWHAGFDARRALDAKAALQATLGERDATIAALRRQVAELDTLKAAQERERQEVSRTIGELQAEVARQSQQLDFLRGVVAGGTAPAPSVAIRELRVAPTQAPGRYLLRIALARPGRPEREVTGSVRITVEGQRNGRLARLELREVSPSQTAQLTYRFLYFENLEQELALPSGFRPERVLVEVRPSERGAAPVTRTLLWAVDGPT
jgi:hypothetical protein